MCNSTAGTYKTVKTSKCITAFKIFGRYKHLPSHRDDLEDAFPLGMVSHNGYTKEPNSDWIKWQDKYANYADDTGFCAFTDIREAFNVLRRWREEDRTYSDITYELWTIKCFPTHFKNERHIFTTMQPFKTCLMSEFRLVRRIDC